MSERVLDGLVAAKLAIAEIEGRTQAGWVGEQVFEAIRNRLNEMISEEMRREHERLKTN